MLQLLPLHPILVHFPLAMIPFAALFDIIAKSKRRPSLAHAAWWCLLGAAVISPLTATSGWLWFRDFDAPAGTEMFFHKWMGTIIPFLLIVLAIWRYRAHKRDTFPTSLFLTVFILMAFLVTLQGHLGGTMTFGEVASAASVPVSQESDEISPPTTHPTTLPDIPPTTTQSTEDGGWLDAIKVRSQP